MMVVLVVGGLILLIGGGELLVRGAVALARGFGVSALVIGLTVVAFGTSAPELVVSLDAALGGHADIVLGNVVGSNIANLLLIIGGAALVSAMPVPPELVRRDGALLFVITTAFVALCLLGSIGRLAGAILVLVLAAYTLRSFHTARRLSPGSARLPQEEIAATAMSLPIAFLVTVFGIAGVVLGAQLLIDGAVQVARLAGLSEAVIGLTLIAFGTSLPELAAAGMAALRGHSDLALGNVLGSNLFNMLAIAGITAIVTPVPVPGELLRFDLWFMLAITAAVPVMMILRQRVSRVDGGVLVVGYSVYIAALATGVLG